MAHDPRFTRYSPSRCNPHGGGGSSSLIHVELVVTPSTGDLTVEHVLNLGSMCHPMDATKGPMMFTFTFPRMNAPSMLPWGVKVSGFLAGAITSYTIHVAAYNKDGEELGMQTASPKWPSSSIMNGHVPLVSALTVHGVCVCTVLHSHLRMQIHMHLCPSLL